MRELKLILAAVVTLIYYGCNKTEVSVPDPIVEFIEPYNNQAFSIFDTVIVKADIEHTQSIKRLSISIYSKDLKPLTSDRTIDIQQSSYALNSYIILDNKYIEEELNYLLLKIEDQDGVYNFWQQIIIHPLNRDLEKIIVVTGLQNNNTLNIADLSGDIEQMGSWTSEYIGGYADSRNRMFYTCGELIDGIRAYNITETQPLWLIPARATASIPYYNSFTAIDGRVTVGTSEGVIESYNNAGLKIFSSQRTNGGRFMSILHHNNFVIGAFRPFVGEFNSLFVFNDPSGSVYASFQFAGEVIQMINGDNNDVLIILEINGVIKAYTYNFTVNTLVFIKDLTTGEVNQITGGADNIFLSMSDGVVWYRPDVGSAVKYLTTPGIGPLAYDNISNILFFARDSKMYLTNLPSETILDSVEFDAPIKDIKLLYNK